MENPFSEIQKSIQEFCEARDWDQYHSPKELSIGLVTEASELLELFRFMSEEQIQEMFNQVEKRESIEDEMADVLFFLLRLAQMKNVNLVQSLERKMQKNSRKYPVEKSFGSNKKYTEL